MTIEKYVSSSVGWGILVGVGAAFAILMVGLSWLLSKYMNEVQDSEMLATSRRSVKTGLVASAVVSSWTIGATLLLSCKVAYNDGVAGAWWYGAGSCVQIIIFCCAAIQLKRRAPNAHTFQEVVRYRYGTKAHLVMCFYSFIQQLFATANLLVNGSSIFSNMAGLNRIACDILMPFFVIIYTLMGGIKATFITDWVHVVIIFVVTLMFLFEVYTTSPYIGSPGKMWEMLVAAGEKYPVDGNKDGSLLTFQSVNAGLYGLVAFGAGWSYAVDSQLFQKAIAAHPEGALSGYILGGLCWFTLPFGLATTMGLACRGLELTKAFPTYPDRLSDEMLSEGLVLPIAAYVLGGVGGCSAILLMVFLACTASFSSEIVAVSALWTYDIYKAYINPKADGKKLVFMQHAGVVVFSLACIVLAIGLGEANVDVGFITTCTGIVVNVCIFPMGFTLFWNKMSPLSMCLTPIISSLIAIATWLGTAQGMYGSININTLSLYGPCAAGNTVAFGISALIGPLITVLKPSNFDWNRLKDIQQDENKTFDEQRGLVNVLSAEETTALGLEQERENDARMLHKLYIGIVFTVVFVLFFLILFPIPLYATGYIFSKSFFRGYIVVTFLWVFFSVFCVVVYPTIQGIPTAIELFKRITRKDPKTKMYSDELVSHVTAITSQENSAMKSIEEKKKVEQANKVVVPAGPEKLNSEVHVSSESE